MSDCIEVRKSYKYRVYRCDKKDRKLRHMIFVASTVWNHFIALQRRYYKLTRKYLSLESMNRHVLKLRKTERFKLWRDLHSQACQDVCRRVDDAYQRYFKKLAKGRPKFKKAKKYASFTFPQSGYKVEDNILTIGKTKYKFVRHRDLAGKLKTLTVKRDKVGRLWLVFSVIEKMSVPKTSLGKSSGFDFGLKYFLVDNEGQHYDCPEYFKQDLDKTRRLYRDLARKVEGSNGYKQARRALAKHLAHIANQRLDFQFKLAHALCADNAVMYFEDLNLQGMKAMWGRKVSDLAFAQFLDLLAWVAFKQGRTVVKIDRFTATTQVCSGCERRHPLTLRDRTLQCPCGLTIDRDENAAKNILRVGTSTPYRSGSKTQVRLRSRVEGRSPAL